MPGQQKSDDRSQAGKRTGKAGGGKQSPKVGSSREADRKVGGKLDFGIPAASAQPPDGGRGRGPEQGTGPMRSGSEGTREDGVGYPPGPAGTGSGGDLDPDVVGLGGAGFDADPPDRTQGPDMTEGGSAAFASGPPARGENQQPPATPSTSSRQAPAGSRPPLDTVDHGGGDASTTGSDGVGTESFTPEQNPDEDPGPS